VTEIGSKGLSIASDVATKGYDVAATTILQANNYSPVNASNFSPNAWGDAPGQPLQYDEPTSTEKAAVNDDWDTWGEPTPTTSSAKPEPQPEAKLEDNWDEF
jgi:hypothetical protein